MKCFVSLFIMTLLALAQAPPPSSSGGLATGFKIRGGTLPATPCQDGLAFQKTSGPSMGPYSCTNGVWVLMAGSAEPVDNYSVSFTSQTSVVANHAAGTTKVLISCYDTSGVLVEPASITLTDTNNATITFQTAQSGTCVVNTVGGGGGGGGGITTLNGLTIGSQTFTNDTNVTVTSAGSAHAMGWAGTLSVARGGTGAASEANARISLLPSYTSNASRCLKLNSGATDVEWATCTDLTAGSGIEITDGVVSMTDAVAQQLYGTDSLNFPSINNAACSDLTLTVTGAQIGDTVAAGWPASLPAGVFGTMFVSIADTVVVRVCNLSGSSVDLAASAFSARIIRSF
jgi:hypothetical protein